MSANPEYSIIQLLCGPV